MKTTIGKIDDRQLSKGQVLKILNVLILYLFITSSAYAEDPVQLHGECRSGLNSLGRSAYSILVFCEDALGDYIGVVLSGHWPDNASKRWAIDDRYWHQSIWGNDVTSYFFDKNRDVLYIATSGYYGTAGVYKLELRDKKYERCIWRERPKDTTEGSFSIDSVSNSKLDILYTESANRFNFVLDVNKDMPCVLQAKE